MRPYLDLKSLNGYQGNVMHHFCKVRGVVLLLFIALFSVSTTAWAEGRLRHRDFSIRGGLGMSFGPEKFLANLQGDWNVDRFFSIGPMIQMGMDSSPFSIFSAGGKLHLPIPGEVPLRFSLPVSAGYAVRRVKGVSFHDFAFATGFQAEYDVLADLSVGVGGWMTFLSSDVERRISAVAITTAYHF